MLRQETRKFLSLLEKDGKIGELESLRTKMRAIADLLKEKEDTTLSDIGFRPA